MNQPDTRPALLQSAFIERPLPNLAGWAVAFDRRDIPVLAAT